MMMVVLAKRVFFPVAYTTALASPCFTVVPELTLFDSSFWGLFLPRGFFFRFNRGCKPLPHMLLFVPVERIDGAFDEAFKVVFCPQGAREYEALNAGG